MKKKNIILLIIILVLLVSAVVLAVLLSAAGNSHELELKSTDLTANVRRDRVEVTEDLSAYGSSVTDFSLRLFQNTMEPGENSLISPLSVLGALGMTANGADGETLAQFESVLGLSQDEINQFLYSFVEMAEEREINRLHLANALWMKDDNKLTVREEFLKSAASYYHAGIYKTAFDKRTKEDINAWVDYHTKGMIPEILSEIPEEAMVYLVNALSFEGEWERTYYAYQVSEGVFTTEGGEDQVVEMMHSSESCYLKDENATGFMKYYKNREYAFVALLPNEGVTVEEYVMGLTGEQLYQLISAPEETLVETGLPKFESDSAYELSNVLGNMGMTDIFDGERANLSSMGTYSEGNLFINRVLHKTFISVTEEGTRAGAATVMEAAAGAAPDPKIVFLDRPFLYMIIDCETVTPIFMGTLMTME